MSEFTDKLEDMMPVVCDCGETFDLSDGYPSLHSNKVICEECHLREESLSEIETEIENLEYDIETLQDDIFSYEESLEEARQSIEEKRKELTKKREELEEL